MFFTQMKIHQSGFQGSADSAHDILSYGDSSDAGVCIYSEHNTMVINHSPMEILSLAVLENQRIICFIPEGVL